jgi:competence protein ComEA
MTVRERATLAALGMLALAALAVLAWQRRPVPLTITAAPASSAAWDGRLADARQVDVNTADASELERLPGVGPALARRIVEDRESYGAFGSLEELTRVRGIGSKTIEGAREYLTAGQE